MATIIQKRLEMMGDKVLEGVVVCQGIVNRLQQGEQLTNSDKIEASKLKMAMNRLNNEIQSYSYQHQGPSSEDMNDLLEGLTAINIKADDILVELDLKRENGDRDNPHPSGDAPHTTPVSTTSRLPQLNLPTFDGNKLNWYEFWGKFTASIERRADLSDIDKLTYLQDCLQGNAKELIAGLTTTNETYKIAIDTLKEEFGEEGVIIDAHYTALFGIPAATQDVKDNKRVLNDIDKHLRVLDAMGENTGHNNAIRGLIINKFSAEIQSNLRMKITPTRENVNTIMNCLKLIIKALDNNTSGFTLNTHPSGFTTEALYSQSGGTKPHEPVEGNKKRKQHFGDKRDKKQYKQNQENNNQKTSEKFTSQKDNDLKKKRSNLHCIFCSGSHIHEKCRQLKTLEERKAKLKGRCYLCLRENHSVQDCKTQMPACVHCGRERHHNRALCPKICPKEEKATNAVTLFSQTDYDTILQTAVASIPCGGHKVIQAKLLFDCGSQKSYVLSSVAKKLNLPVLEETCLTVFTFGSTTPKTMHANLVNIPIQLKGYQVDIMAYVVPSTTGLIPSHRDFKMRIRKALPSLDWAEDTIQDVSADIIIGNDYYYKFVMPDRKKIAENLYVIKTGLGWVLSGTFQHKEAADHQLSVLTFVAGGCICKGEDIFFLPDPAIRDGSIKMLWELEAIGITDSPKVVQDENVIEFFNKTTKFIENRYYVKWPWVEYPPILPTNFGLACGRLRSLLKRLEPQHLQRYNEVLVEQREKGIIEEVLESASSQPHPIHYLPHHCVIQEHKSTKLRIVYDASAKIKGQCSLNELLYKGPLMLVDLITLLLNFRRHTIGLVADVEKAFLQVGLQQADRDVTRFLWLRDINDPPCDNNLIHLRFCRVPFGIISSPFLLSATIRYHLNSKSCASAHALASCIYVDNLVTGADTLPEAKQLYTTATDSLGELSMNLRGWNSNDKPFVRHLPDAHRDTEVKITVLGLVWDTNDDVLRLAFDISKLDKPTSTKREVLRAIASVYDPCGFVAPLTLPTRTFLQDLWTKGLKWDAPLSPDQKAAWDTCVTYLRGVALFSIPRPYCPVMSLVGKPLELHCFTDASLDAYVAVVYIRVSSRNTHVNFVISRSRVTPLQRKATLTIPKLELLAVVIGTRLLTYVRSALNLEIVDTFLWTDSQAVLGWLRSERLLPPWVSRRVGEARKAAGVRFRYVPSTLNPADVATRPLQQNVVPDCWVDGPTFLRHPPNEWPFDTSVYTAEPDTLNLDQATPHDPERQLITEILVNPVVSLKEFDLPTHGSQLPIPAILCLQKVHFKDEVAKKSTNLSRALNTFVDDQGIVRCKGRYQNAILPYEQRCPILLPPDSDLTSWVIQRVHTDNYHVGVSHTLALVRHHYWIPRGRNAVSKVLRRCPECVKYGGGPYRLPAMPDLPVERITYSSPFTYTGVDYLGPLIVVHNGSTQKRWVCLYTCMAVRAVHLELVSDLSAEEFILCLRRFVSVRGAPKLLLSDNAANFKMAAQVLRAPTVQQQRIDWKFITELSPWQGGLYERLVGLVKHCLHRTVDKSLLTDNQLFTVIKEIEGVLNTRPLTTVGQECDLVLTPSCFLRASGPLTLLPPDRTDQFRTDIQRRVVDGWKRTEALLKEFQKMFATQYLLSLRERHTPLHKQPRVLSYKEPSVGDAVQIKGDTNNRALWKVGRISALRPSVDGQVRSVQVVLDDGTLLNRSVAHLYPLELDVSHTQPSPHRASPPDAPVVPPDDRSSSPVVHGPAAASPAMDVPHPSLPATSSSASPGGGTSDTQAAGTQAPTRPQRQAAHRARQQIRQWVTTMLSLATLHLSTRS